MTPRDRDRERAYVTKVAEDITQLLEVGHTHPRMREIQIQAFLDAGYEPEMVAGVFGVDAGELERICGAVAARET